MLFSKPQFLEFLLFSQNYAKVQFSIGTLLLLFLFFLTFLEPLFYKLSFSLSKSLLCIFIVIGVYFLVPQFSAVNNYFVGICWGVLSGFFMALAILWSRFLSSKFPTVVISFFQSFYCALLSLPFLFLLLPLQISLREWTMLLILGFICTASSAYLLELFFLKSISAQVFGLKVWKQYMQFYRDWSYIF